jgi:hypothetical protein
MEHCPLRVPHWTGPSKLARLRFPVGMKRYAADAQLRFEVLELLYFLLWGSTP